MDCIKFLSLALAAVGSENQPYSEKLLFIYFILWFLDHTLKTYNKEKFTAVVRLICSLSLGKKCTIKVKGLRFIFNLIFTL